MELFLTILGIVLTVIIGLLPFIKTREKKAAIKRNIGVLGSDAFETIHSDNFIPTMGQENDPNEEKESGTDSKSSRLLLSKVLIKEIQQENDGVKKLRYFILGGTGMGKTLFLASFIEYYYKQSIFSLPPFHIYSVYLGGQNCLNEITSIQNYESILILDALDENAEAVCNFDSFFMQLEGAFNRFRIVIITSRTQFFANSDVIPERNIIRQNGGEKVYYKRYYISPFNDNEMAMLV